MVTEDRIKELAYALWEKEGRPEGKDVEHYFTAKSMLEEHELTQPHTNPSKVPVATQRSTLLTPKATPTASTSDPRSTFHSKKH